MRVEFLCFVVRDKKGNIVKAEPIIDMYSNVTMELGGKTVRLEAENLCGNYRDVTAKIERIEYDLK